jgi:hypothetical protein
MRKSEQPVIMKRVQKKKDNDGQQSIDKFCLKKSGSNNVQKVKQASTNGTANLNDVDEDDEDSF